MENMGRKINKIARSALLAGVALLHPDQGDAQVAQKIERPPIKRESAQRTAYQSPEQYTKYAEEMESQNQRTYETTDSKIQKKIDEYMKNASDCLKKGLTDLAFQWIDLANTAREEKNKNSIAFLRTKRPIQQTEEEIKKVLSINHDIIPGAFARADIQREWLADNLYSKEYEERLLKNEGMPKKELDRRRKIVIENEPSFKDAFHQLENAKGEYLPTDVLLPRPGETPGRYIINPQVEGNTFIHELEHAVTDANNSLSPIAKQLYLKSFKPILGMASKEKKYLSDPTEMDARKKVFEYEMEKLGVYKYGEKFTLEHLLKALELELNDKLSSNSKDFLDFNSDEGIIKIMNTIAENRPNDKDGRMKA